MVSTNLQILTSLTNQLSIEEENLLGKLKQYEDGLKILFVLSSDLMCIADKEKFTLINPAWTKILGWSTAELLAEPWINFVHPDDVEKTRNIATTMEIDGINSFHNRYRCKNGNYVSIRWSATPWINSITYAIGVVDEGR